MSSKLALHTHNIAIQLINILCRCVHTLTSNVEVAIRAINVDDPVAAHEGSSLR